jgi:hypothetical protein
MINTDNYYSNISAVDFSSLPEPLRKGHEYVNKVTMNGTSWTAYNSSPTIQKVIDAYFEKLSEHIPQQKSHEESAPLKREGEPKPKKQKRERVKKEPAPKKHKEKTEEAKEDFELIERLPDELRFMRRYIKMHGMKKTKDELLRFINALQKAILERRIRKESAYAKQVMYMQTNLLKVYNEMKGKAIEVQINSKTLNEFEKEIGAEKVMPSIQLIKRYVNLHGKTGIKEKAKQLFEQITNAVKKKKILKNDKYAEKLNEIWNSLQAFLSDKKQTSLPMNSAELNGLLGFLGNCECGLNGIDEAEPGKQIMSSVDFAKMKFNSLGFTGKWKELMGDPSSGFTAMVYGKPKFGKSYLCVEFAGYLARNHGKTLYVAREEKLDATLQKKLSDKNVAHPNLIVSDFLPEDLSNYKFIFLDSVNKLGLSPEDLDNLRNSYPDKSFIFIFQTTKQGAFRGQNEFMHDVDMVIEVPEKGKAVQFGRFNQGGETEIF